MSIDLSLEKRLGERFLLKVEASTDGGILGVLGASGSGKSMTLKCLAGIETPDRGRIAVNGRALFESERKVNVKPQKRRVGYLFQNYALFPKMTVEQNIGVGVPGAKADRRRTVADFVARFRLEGLERRYPDELSGGQQQRVALARMLAARPDVVLLDEPFSALDHHLREQMQNILPDMLVGCRNVVMVTHSRDEAYKLCSDLLVLDDGKVLGGGRTRELFANPVSMRVAQLTGCKNYSRLKRLGERRLRAIDWDLELDAAAPIPGWAEYVGVRAHDLTPADGPDAGSGNLVTPRLVKRVEEPFEWCVVFTNAAAESTRRGEIWWKCSKYLTAELPARLRIPPEALLFLKGDAAPLDM